MWNIVGAPKIFAFVVADDNSGSARKTRQKRTFFFLLLSLFCFLAKGELEPVLILLL